MKLAAVKRDPSIDCPPCPKCGALCGTPASVDCGVAPMRWHGPDNATLFCPSCGAGWVGTVEDFLQAARAWIAYEDQENHERASEIAAEAVNAWFVRAKTTPAGLTHAEVAIVERLVADLESA